MYSLRGNRVPKYVPPPRIARYVLPPPPFAIFLLFLSGKTEQAKVNFEFTQTQRTLLVLKTL